MQRFHLGSIPVARIGFGAMQLPGPGVFGPPREREQALAVLARAVELGVDHIDTAQFYGPDVANELIRAALHPYPETLALLDKGGSRLPRSGRLSRIPARGQCCFDAVIAAIPFSSCVQLAEGGGSG